MYRNITVVQSCLFQRSLTTVSRGGALPSNSSFTDITPDPGASMETFGWVSVLPPIIAIGLAIWSKQVYLSLGLFILLGWTIMNSWNPIAGLVQSVDTMVAVVGDPDNARVLMFSSLIGAMVVLTQRSGGMAGFVSWAANSRIASSKRSVGLFAGVVSMFVFLESNFGLLVTGSVARPLFDKCKISREKLAYVLDATCAPKCILIPINAWGAYVVSLLAAQDVENPVGLMVSSLFFNFYAILALLLVFFVIVTDKNVGPMKEAERRVTEEGKLLRDGAEPMVTTDVASVTAKDGVPQRAMNMIIPIVAMVGAVPVVLYFTGKGDVMAATAMERVMAGSGSRAVLWGVIVGLLTAAVLYKAQGIMTVKEVVDDIIKGIEGLIPLVIVLLLAFTIASTTRALGTGVWVAQAAQATLPAGVVPAVVFLLACFIAFSTGTSWGTFAIMIPIVVPMIELLGLHPGLVVAAALGGGIFGDHCSPISDSTIVASMASATDHIDHVRTQLPYSLTAAAGAIVLFLVFGFVL
jgi:tetracycline resistance efflux pump